MVFLANVKRAEILILGAGIAGVAIAYWLAVRQGMRGVVLVDRLAPLSFTTAASGENFRKYWPQPALQALAGRSIDLMESMANDHGNPFNLSFSGYEFVSERDSQAVMSAFGDLDQAGDDAVDVVSGSEAICRNRPYLSEAIQSVVRVHRAGAVDVNALGSWLLRGARQAGVQFHKAEVTALAERSGGGFDLEVRSDDEAGHMIADKVVVAAGPFTGRLAGMLGESLPLENILQRKIVVPDPSGVIPRDMPFTIFADAQRLDWLPEEVDIMESDPQFAWLRQEFPAGLHVKPESATQIKLGWAFNRQTEAPQLQPANDDLFPEVAMRGASRFLPGLRGYVDSMPQPVVQFAGYYTRTRENLPLIGPLGDRGAFTLSALSGFGTMVACAAGELCAKWVTCSELPDYARALAPDRHEDVGLMNEIAQVSGDGQL